MIFGSYALSKATQTEADRVLSLLLECGVNHIDTAPMYGNAEQFPSFSRHLRNLTDGNDRIEFSGTFSYERLLEVHSALDLLVVPSVWYENSPNTILEAFTYRTPIIAANLGGMAELVRDEENGLLFKPGDPRSLQQQILRIEENPHLLNNLRSGITPVRTLLYRKEAWLGIGPLHQLRDYSVPRRTDQGGEPRGSGDDLYSPVASNLHPAG